MARRQNRLAWLVPSATSSAARTPFVLLVVVLLGSGLIALLLLNAAVNQGEFRLSKLRKETTSLTDEEQALQHDVDTYSAPDALARRAQRLGMVPGGPPVFLGPEGSVRGTPSPAAAPPSPAPSANPRPSADSASAKPTASRKPGSSPSGKSPSAKPPSPGPPSGKPSSARSGEAAR